MTCELLVVAVAVLASVVIGLVAMVLVLWDWERIERKWREERERR